MAQSNKNKFNYLKFVSNIINVKQLFITALVSISIYANAQKNKEMTQAIEQVVQTALDENRIVGAVITVAQDGKIVYEKASGFADKENKIPMKTDDVFLLASVTKPMVSTVVMKFIEDGKLSLQDPATKYLPYFTPKMTDGSTPVITIQELLTHSSGLSYRFMEDQSSDYYKYNVSDGLVSEYVTQPLKMENTAFSVKDKTKLVSFYANKNGGVEKMYDGIFVPLEGAGAVFAPSRILDPKSYHSGGGGMAGTATDLLKFFEAIRKNDGTLLKKETIVDMMKDHVGEQAQTQGPGWGFGFGWAVLDDASKTNSPMSNGSIQWGGAYGHRWFIDPNKKLTVIALTNTTFEGMNGKFPEDITKVIYKSLK